MADKKKYPSALVWVDIEATGLPVGNDYSGVEILEIAIIATDFDLQPHFGYNGIVKMNDTIKAALAKNPEVVQMHLDNGLLKDSKASEDTLQVIEAEIVGMLKTKTTQDKGEFMIAGSGVAAYDFPLIKEKMPELASWFHYASFDIGATRRAAYYLSGRRDVVPKVAESFAAGSKNHRALDDVKAHIKEANNWRTFYRAAVDEATAS